MLFFAQINVQHYCSCFLHSNDKALLVFIISRRGLNLSLKMTLAEVCALFVPSSLNHVVYEVCVLLSFCVFLWHDCPGLGFPTISSNRISFTFSYNQL